MNKLLLPALLLLLVLMRPADSQSGADLGPLAAILTAVQNGVTNTGVASSVAVSTKAGVYTVVALDVASITTGGTAVTAITAGHASAGCVIFNSGTSVLVINQIGTATGTTTAGNNIAIPAGQQWNCIPSSNAVSAVSATSSYAFGGYGQQ